MAEAAKPCAFKGKEAIEMKCSDDLYGLLQRRRDHLISAKILLREVEREREKALKEGLLEVAEREGKLFKSYLGLVRDIEDQIKELERKCF